MFAITLQRQKYRFVYFLDRWIGPFDRSFPKRVKLGKAQAKTLLCT